jgi:hypothetical protein
VGVAVAVGAGVAVAVGLGAGVVVAGGGGAVVAGGTVVAGGGGAAAVDAGGVTSSNASTGCVVGTGVVGGAGMVTWAKAKEDREEERGSARRPGERGARPSIRYRPLTGSGQQQDGHQPDAGLATVAKARQGRHFPRSTLPKKQKRRPGKGSAAGHPAAPGGGAELDGRRPGGVQAAGVARAAPRRRSPSSLNSTPWPSNSAGPAARTGP